MRTTIDLPDELFREVKTRAVQQGTSLKNLMTQYIRSGLSAQTDGASSTRSHRPPPPVAIRRAPGLVPAPPRSNRQLHAILEEEDVHASRHVGSRGRNKE
jgi:hypothetical protein